MLVSLLGVGIGALLLVGVWGLYAGRLSERGGRGQLFIDDVTYLSRVDIENPRRLLEPSRAANLVIAALELLLLVIATLTLLELSTRSGVPTWFVAGSTFAVLVGGYVLGRAVYVRVGFAVPEPTDDVDAFGAGFETVAGTDAAADFTAIHDAMQRTRGDGNSDAVTAAVLAAARADVDRTPLETWAAESGLASPASVEARIDALANAGVVDPDAFTFVDDRLETAAPSDLASLTTSIQT
jgi:hypothetical protein